MDEKSIIAGCISGNRIAQKALFDNYSKGMLYLCRRYVKDNHNAEEILLNGFYKFYAAIDRFEYKGDKSVGGWLKKIMINECLLFLREKKKIAFVQEEHAIETAIDEQALEKMNTEVLLRLINSLPDGYRVVFNMYVIEGYNHREIGEILQIAEGTSKSQLSKAKVMLQQLIQKEEIAYER